MNKTTLATAAGLLALLGHQGWAAGFDGKTNLLCTATEIYECDAAGGCGLLDAVDAYHVQHLNIDMQDQTVTLDHLETGFSSAIDRVETVENKLVLQGIEEGTSESLDGGGWTVTIDNRYGTMTFTMTGGGYVFAGMGGCVQAR